MRYFNEGTSTFYSDWLIKAKLWVSHQIQLSTTQREFTDMVVEIFITRFAVKIQFSYSKVYHYRKYFYP